MNKPFYCKVVGMQITGDVCETRIKQAKEFRDKGEPHASLNKCIICKGLAPTESAPTAEDEILCPQCKRPKVYKKLRWNKKHGMHVNCYYVLSKKGTAEVAVSRPAPGVKVTTVEQPPGRVVPDTSEQDHYTSCKIQPIDFIVANSMDFLEGNIVKYIARYKNKNGLEDLAKARHYLDMLIEREEAAANE